VKTALAGVLLGLVAAFPHLAGQGAAPLVPVVLWAASQPIVWAFTAGALVGPRTARALLRRFPWAP
jgi:hypothetical protein